MLDSHYQARKLYGSTYVTIFDDETIPWKLLPLKDYISYSYDIARGIFSLADIENEIFCKCVLDKILVNQLDYLKAGTVTLVAQHIWQYSGPTTIDSFNQALEAARIEYHSSNFAIIHKLIKLISLAFPYKPEEIYAMDYETFITRVIQAEDKLLQVGIITERVFIEAEVKEKPLEQKPKVDLKKLFEQERQPVVENTTLDVQPQTDPKTKKKWYTKSPVLEAKPTHGINFSLEQKEIDIFGTTGHEKTDLHLNRAKMIKDAQVLYKDLIEELNSKKNNK